MKSYVRVGAHGRFLAMAKAKIVSRSTKAAAKAPARPLKGKAAVAKKAAVKKPPPAKIAAQLTTKSINKRMARPLKKKPAAAKLARRPAPKVPRPRAADPQLPRHADLPIRAGAPAGAAWGVFGDDDQVGTINLMTPDRVIEAADSIRSGRVFSLNLPIDIPESAPVRPRQACPHD